MLCGGRDAEPIEGQEQQLKENGVVSSWSILN